MSIVAPADRPWKFSRKLKEPDVANKEPVEQQTMGDIVVKPSAKLKKAGGALTTSYYKWKELGEETSVARGVVLELMQKEGVDKFQIDGAYEVSLAHTDKVTLKTLKEED